MWVTSAALNNLQVDGAYVFNQLPTPVAGQGVPTSKYGIVGTGSWGPLNTPVPFSDTASLYGAFGTFATAALSGQPYSLVLEAQFALAFSNNGVGVRVAHGDEAAATSIVLDSGATNGVLLTGFYTGTEGDNISYALSTGSNSTTGAPTMTATIQRLGFSPEVYPNLPNASGGGFAAALIAAINNGIAGVRGPSALVVASVHGSASTANFANTASPVYLTGGANGEDVTSAQQKGTDGTTTARSGMFALRGTGVSQFILAGNSDAAVYPDIATFAESEGCLGVLAFPAGTSSASAISIKQIANCVSRSVAPYKDWVNFTDPVTGIQRLVSPLGDVLGLIASLPPEASPGNKPVAGITNINSTERTGLPYSYAEAQMLQAAGIGYITNPIPRGAVYGLPHGENASASVVGLNAVTDNISYTRMTNYLGASFVGILGQYVDELQGSAPNDPTRTNAKASLSQFLQSLQDQGRIDQFKVVLDLSNNTPITIAEGFGLALIQVAYMNVVKFWLVTLNAGSAIQLSLGNVPQGG